MPSFESTAATFYTEFQSPTKHNFKGTLFHAVERDVKLADSNQARLFLRVPPDCVVGSGDEMFDHVGRRYLLADFDESLSYRTHRAILMTHFTTWERNVNTVDPVTKLPRAGGTRQSLGPIWVALELLSKTDRDSTLNTTEDVTRIITRHPLALNDRVHDLIVRRVSTSLGVTLAEAQ